VPLWHSRTGQCSIRQALVIPKSAHRAGARCATHYINTIESRHVEKQLCQRGKHKVEDVRTSPATCREDTSVIRKIDVACW